MTEKYHYMPCRISRKDWDFALVDVPFQSKRKAIECAESYINGNYYKKGEIIIVKSRNGNYWGVYARIIDRELRR